MTGWITSLVFLALAAAASPAQAQAAIVVGAVVSQTGMNADLAADYGKALKLWEAELNAAGGLLGRPVELRLLDDASQATRVAELYRRLIVQDRAQLLIGPYGSAATRGAAGEAERERRVMVNPAGPARVAQEGATRWVFQTSAPYAAYGAGVLALAREQGFTRLQIFARDEFATREMAEETRLAALALGFAVPEVEPYSLMTVDFAPQVTRAAAAQAQAWLAFGELHDAIEMVKTFRKVGYAPRLFFARKSTEPGFVQAVGQDAEFTLGIVEYHRRSALDSNPAFVKSYNAKWSALPSLAAAQAYAGASVLAAAVRRAGTLDQEKLRIALIGLEAETLLGHYKVDPAGAQVGTKPAIAQIQLGRPELVWPPGRETGKPMQLYPQWSERKVLR